MSTDDTDTGGLLGPGAALPGTTIENLVFVFVCMPMLVTHDRRASLTTPYDATRLSVVDMADAARAPAVLKGACERYGFFYLANHGVPLPLVDEVRAACRRVDG